MALYIKKFLCLSRVSGIPYSPRPRRAVFPKPPRNTFPRPLPDILAPSCVTLSKRECQDSS